MIYTPLAHSQSSHCRVFYFLRQNGRAPVEEYLDTINDHRQLAAIFLTITRLQQLGRHLPEPIVKHVEGKIWELRTRFGNRIFYAVHGDDIILLDGHTKKRDRLESRVLERVRNNYQTYLITGQRKQY